MTRHTRRRIATVILAPAAALLAWAVIRLAGIHLTVSGPGARSTVHPGDVVFAALVCALAGLFVVRLLERHSSRPRRHWAMIASMAFAVSMIGPSRLADGESAAALIALHVVTAVAVMLGFAETLPLGRCRRLVRRAPTPSEGHSAG